MKESNIVNKLILVTFLALLCSFLSALYISTVQAADVAPIEIQMPGTWPGEIDDFKSSIKFDDNKRQW